MTKYLKYFSKIGLMVLSGFLVLGCGCTPEPVPISCDNGETFEIEDLVFIADHYTIKYEYPENFSNSSLVDQQFNIKSATDNASIKHGRPNIDVTFSDGSFQGTAYCIERIGKDVAKLVLLDDVIMVGHEEGDEDHTVTIYVLLIDGVKVINYGNCHKESALSTGICEEVAHLSDDQELIHSNKSHKRTHGGGIENEN